MFAFIIKCLSDKASPVLSNAEHVISVLAGSGQLGSADGLGLNAQFSSPIALCGDDVLDAIYVYDSGSGIVRMVTSSGNVSTITPGKRDDKDECFYNLTMRQMYYRVCVAQSSLLCCWSIPKSVFW